MWGPFCCRGSRVRLRLRRGPADKCAAPLAPAGGEKTTSSSRRRRSRCDRPSRIQRPRQWETFHTVAEMSTAAFYLLSTLGGYLVTSFLLLKYPTLLHQRKKQRFLSKHISHRGGERGPQNPMAEMGEAFFFFWFFGARQKAGGWKYVRI